MEPFEVLTNSRFYLELKLQGSNDLIDGYFIECQGFKRTQEAIEVAEVTPQKWGGKPAQSGRVIRTKLPGNTKSENITLRYGMTISPTMWKWFRMVEQGQWAKQFRDGDLTIYNQAGEVQARFRFLGAWPVSYKVGDVKADGSDFQVEELELAVEEFIRVKPDGNEYT
ncbi:MAG: phage tail protein [Leptolyngbyaceae cyanobacterium MO_188.B28]|nr:phage tail protein [Leptolyngbyaceae cyanobacterium MO_188.B28]